MMNITMQELLQVIGEQQIQIILLQRELAKLTANGNGKEPEMKEK